MADRRIKDIQEELFTCQICLQPFNNPKSLPCLHTFCAQCLREWLQKHPLRQEQSLEVLNCPVCVQVAYIENGIEGLPNNFMITKLEECFQTLTVTMQLKEVKKMCERCRSGNRERGERVAFKHCSQCNINFCHQCSDDHLAKALFKTHTLADISSDISCERHDRAVSYYCITCDRAMCAIDTEEHTDEAANHNIMDLQTGLQNHRTLLKRLLASAKSKINIIDQFVDILPELHTMLETSLSETRSNIEDAGERKKSLIQSSRERLSGLLSTSVNEGGATKSPEQVMMEHGKMAIENSGKLMMDRVEREKQRLLESCQVNRLSMTKEYDMMANEICDFAADLHSLTGYCERLINSGNALQLLASYRVLRPRLQEMARGEPMKNREMKTLEFVASQNDLEIGEIKINQVHIPTVVEKSIKDKGMSEVKETSTARLRLLAKFRKFSRT